MSLNTNDGNSDRDRDRDTLSQIEAIAAEIASTQPLTSPIQPLSTLLDLYTTTPPPPPPSTTTDATTTTIVASDNFLEGGKYLIGTYKSWRRVRGDGNCYYRAFLYSLCESLLPGGGDGNTAEYDRVCALVTSSIETVASSGYDRFTVETFHEELLDLLLSLPQTTTTPATLHDTLTVENAASDYCTWYLRLLTSVHLQARAEEYAPYLTGEGEWGGDMRGFCKKEVEPMGRECEMVQVAALAEFFGVRVRIEYLDGRDLVEMGDGSGRRGVVRHEFGPEGSGCVVTLLYRPGHYDILY